MRVITWNRSFKAGVLNPDEGKDDFDSEENETHATVLDKMLAWEKKLYDEVKVFCTTPFSYLLTLRLCNNFLFASIYLDFCISLVIILTFGSTQREKKKRKKTRIGLGH